MVIKKKSDARTSWNVLASKEAVERTMQSLKEKGIIPYFVGSSEEAKNKVISIIPKGSEIMTMSSRTLEETGILKEIEESGNFDTVRKKFSTMDKDKQGHVMKQLGAAPSYAIGSIHALTEKGEAIIASASGSQLPAYAYGADQVIWVVGTQKIVSTLEEGMKRLYDYVLPLEDARAKKAYGVGSNVNKLLIINKESSQNRIHLILINEVLGF